MGALQRSLTLSAVGVVAVLALAGCGSVGGVRDGSDGSSGGTWEATLGGHAIELEDDDVVCEQAEGSMHLRIGDIDPANPSRATGISAIVGGPPDGLEVRIVHISLPDGTTLLYSPASARGPGVPKTGASIDGDTYTIDGAGTVNDPSGRGSTTAFTITVTCA